MCAKMKESPLTDQFRTTHFLCGMQKFLLFLFLGTGFIANSQTMDTISVYFELDNRTDFDRLSLGQRLNTRSIVSIGILGYADYLGESEYNQKLSEDRAQLVANYIKTGWNHKVTKVSGKGEVSTSSSNEDGEPKHRRVDVIITRKDKVGAQQVADSKPLIEPPTTEIPSTMELETKILDIDTSESASIVLEGVGFIPGRHYPMPDSYDKLEQLLATMKAYPTLKIEIQGFICCDYSQFDGLDNDTQTMNLSENRAKFIYDYLIREGVDEDRLSYRGYGSSKPKVFPELNERDRQANRRVEIKVIK